MGNFQVDMQSFNGTWTSDVFSTAYEAYIFIAGLTDAAQVEVNNTNVSSLEALDKWYAASTQPTDAPAEVDMGGDFEGFVEAVNAPRAEPTRIKQLRDRIASQERELIDLRLELSQLLGGK